MIHYLALSPGAKGFAKLAVVKAKSDLSIANKVWWLEGNYSRIHPPWEQALFDCLYLPSGDLAGICIEDQGELSRSVRRGEDVSIDTDGVTIYNSQAGKENHQKYCCQYFGVWIFRSERNIDVAFLSFPSDIDIGSPVTSEVKVVE